MCGIGRSQTVGGRRPLNLTYTACPLHSVVSRWSSFGTQEFVPVTSSKNEIGTATAINGPNSKVSFHRSIGVLPHKYQERNRVLVCWYPLAY